MEPSDQQDLALYANGKVSSTISFRIEDPEALHALAALAKAHGFESHHLFARFLTIFGMQQLASAARIEAELEDLRQEVRDGRIDLAVVAEALLVSAKVPAEKAKAWVREKLNVNDA